MLFVLALWVILSAALGLWARTRGRSGLTWFLIGALVSPLIGAILLLAVRDLALEGHPEPRRKHRFFRVVINIIMALLVIGIFISAMNRGGMRPIHLASVDMAAQPERASPDTDAEALMPRLITGLAERLIIS